MRRHIHIALFWLALFVVPACFAAQTLINAATQLMGLVGVANGGTGAGTFTIHGLLVGQTTAAFHALAAGTAGQVIASAGSTTDPGWIDFPDIHIIPAANCNKTTAGAGWSIGSGGTVTCRAGTDNLGGYVSITDTASTFAQFTLPIPDDWDTSSFPYIRFQIGYPGTDASSHTIIPQIKVSCMKGDGSTTDDVAFAAARSASTITINSTANQLWTSSTLLMNSTDLSGCTTGSMMTVQVGRASDSATSAANFYSATVTFPRLLVVQAN